MSNENTIARDAYLRAVTWWTSVRETWRHYQDMQNLADSERLAGELGLSPAEFKRMASSAGGRQHLLEQRLAGLGMSSDDVRALSPLLLRDLERTCACCSEKARCSADMEISAVAAGWESYCPNAGTLKTITG